MINNALHRVRERKQSEFSPLEKQYFLNNKNHLEESPIMRNTQELVDSAEYTRLDEIYDQMKAIHAKQNPQINEGDEIVLERERMESHLDALLELEKIREQYAAENPDVRGMSQEDVYKYITGKVKKHNEIIENIRKGKENAKSENNEPTGE